MPLLASSLQKRLALATASGLVFLGAAKSGFWSDEPIKTRPATGQLASSPRPGTAGTPEGPEARPPATSGTHQNGAGKPGSPDAGEDGNRGDVAGDPGTETADASVIAALEQLERRMSAGMARARSSVVTLEYTALEGPPGSRRLATGVVINLRGDVLSVRIDPPPAPAPGSGSASEKTPECPAIVAHDALGKRHLAHWVATDQETGLTLLQIEPRAVRPIEIAADEPALGGQVVVVGNPLGLGHTVSRGHIAGLDRALMLGSRQLGGLIQVQAPLYPGDSGAVVANLRGQMLGVIRSGLATPDAARSRVERDNDFGFALPVRDILWVADQLRARGHVDRAYLGVRFEPAPGSAGKSRSRGGEADPAPDAAAVTGEGAALRDVMAGTPAAKAGLKAGDAIIAMDGQPIRSAHDLTDRLGRLPAESLIRLAVVRGHGPQRRLLSLELRTSSRSDAGPEPVPKIVGGTADGRSVVPVEARSEPGRLTVGPALTSTAPNSSTVVPAPLSTGEASHRGEKTAGTATGQDNLPPWRRAPGAVSIPGPARSPLRAPVAPPQAEELKLTVPRALTERLEQLERRLDKLEHLPAGPQEQRQASSAGIP